ncbi:MAG TPA: CPXCG motif-containing cysteine-rich protein [Gammaproteobacteria bacterium]|nr:CPXCG motif-containing cysteine-rich protein [Gammaproteobacteria bacterium]
MQRETPATCPYCGERLLLLIDESAGEQRYTEDCQVCCCPILVTVHMTTAGGFDFVETRREND